MRAHAAGWRPPRPPPPATAHLFPPRRRRRVGVTEGMDILDYIASLPSEEERRRAHAVLEEIEEKALQDMQIMWVKLMA